MPDQVQDLPAQLKIPRPKPRVQPPAVEPLPHPTTPLTGSPTPNAETVFLRSKPPLKKRSSLMELRQQTDFPLLKVLEARWPQTFPKDPTAIRPWIVGLCDKVIQQLPEYSKEDISKALEIWHAIHKTVYLEKLAEGGFRYDLDGNPQVEVTEAQRLDARRQLELIRSFHLANTNRHLAKEVFSPLMDVIHVKVKRFQGSFGLTVYVKTLPDPTVNFPKVLNGVPVRVKVPEPNQGFEPSSS